MAAGGPDAPLPSQPERPPAARGPRRPKTRGGHQARFIPGELFREWCWSRTSGSSRSCALPRCACGLRQLADNADDDAFQLPEASDWAINGSAPWNEQLWAERRPQPENRWESRPVGHRSFLQPEPAAGEAAGRAEVGPEPGAGRGFPGDGPPRRSPPVGIETAVFVPTPQWCRLRGAAIGISAAVSSAERKITAFLPPEAPMGLAGPRIRGSALRNGGGCSRRTPVPAAGGIERRERKHSAAPPGTLQGRPSAPEKDQSSWKSSFVVPLPHQRPRRECPSCPRGRTN